VIAIIDYGMGNLHSVAKAFEKAGAETAIVTQAAELREAGAIVLPGVGAFGRGMTNLQARGFVSAIQDAVAAGIPLIGICLGLQLLFAESEEMGEHQGLGLFPGRVRRLPRPLRVPHVGWNQLHVVRPSPLLAGIAEGSYAYFVHSYYADPADSSLVLATTDYGLDLASVVGRDRIYGLQFHPEKSQSVGLRILQNIVQSLKRGAL